MSTVHNPVDSVMYAEIYEQPDALRRALNESRADVERLVAEIRRRDIRFVVLAARGTSDNAAIYAQYLFQIVCGIPTGLATPSVQTLYEANVVYKNTLVVGVSQSGAGEDIIAVLEQARANGALTAAITNTSDSVLAQTCEFVIPCRANLEKAVAATKSYTTTLALFALIAALWADNNELLAALNNIPAATERTLALTDEPTARVAQTLIHATRMLTVARGLHLATAHEAALKIAETSYTTTQAFSSADLLHGPIASVDLRTPCALFLPTGKTVPMMREVVSRLESIGARVLSFAEQDGDIPLGDPGTELLAPILDIVPAQLLAYHLTLARGLDPDNPRGLTKITVTR